MPEHKVHLKAEEGEEKAKGEKKKFKATVSVDNLFEIELPAEIVEIAMANPQLTEEQRIEAIAGSEWARNTAEGFCSFVGVPPEEKSACIERMARTLARRVV